MVGNIFHPLLQWCGILESSSPRIVHSKGQWSEVKVAQSCPTFCGPMDCTVHGILQARILEWVAYPFSVGSSQPRNWTGVSCIAGESLPAALPRKYQRPGAAAYICHCPLTFGWGWGQGMWTPGCRWVPAETPSRHWRSPGDRKEEGSLCLKWSLLAGSEWKPYCLCIQVAKIRSELVSMWATEPEEPGALEQTDLL